ncbi:MAG: type II 3-dehydroquinate dehydratase [Pseudomonadota bacterium]|nr:type II 3-dehydroquinate dehydratase [Pseudomonadota bacterium]
MLDRQTQSTLVINGPNLNLLGRREPDIYGTDTLADITRRCLAIAETSPCTLDFRQSNHEGEIVTWIQEAAAIDTIVINAGAYTHTSIAIHDALKSYPGLVVELHISNPHQRESFRHHSFITATADATAVGLGTAGYDLVIELMCTEANAL